MWATRDYRRLLKLQLLIDEELRSKELTPAGIEKLTRSLLSIIDTKRILRMRPKPRDVDIIELERMKQNRVKAITLEESDPKESLLAEGGGRSAGGEGSSG